MGSDRLGRGARSWGGPRRKTPPSPATEPRHDCELSVSGGIHGGHTHEGRTKEDDGTQGAGPTSCVRRARERKNLAARSQNSRKDGDHNGDEPDDGQAGRRCPRPRLDRRLQKALPRPEPVGKRRYRDLFLAKGATESRTRIFSPPAGSPLRAAPAARRPIRECRRQHHIATITTATAWRRWGAPPLEKAMFFAEFETAAQPPPYPQPPSLRTSAELRRRDCRHHHLQAAHSRAQPRCRLRAATWPRWRTPLPARRGAAHPRRAARW